MSATSRPTKRAKTTAASSASASSNQAPPPRIGHTTFLSLKADLERAKQTTSTTSNPTRRTTTLPAHLLPSTGSHTKKDKGKGKDRTTSSWAHTPASELETARIRANLERKAGIYDRLRRGLHGGVAQEVVRDGGVDWARKLAEQQQQGGHGSDHSLSEESDDATDTTGMGSGGEQVVEYVDELGRTRSKRVKDVPREFLPAHLGGYLEDGEREEGDTAIYGPATSFPVYTPTPSAKGKADAQVQRHFDADWEVRHRGAGFYRFSKDEQTRQKQMEALKEQRDATEVRRKVRPGAASSSKWHRTMQARREVVESERRSVLGDHAVGQRRETIDRARLESVLGGVGQV